MRALVLFWIVILKVLAVYLSCVSTIDMEAVLMTAVKFIDIDESNLECVLGLSANFSLGGSEDTHLNVTQLIAKYNYPVEEFYVTTEDGYILNVIRIRNVGPAVFLMHGFLSSADDFVTTNLPNSIAYKLWLEGYDVWMGNARGNKYSRRHVSLDPDTDNDFWDFSWDEIGRIDLTTMIDFVLEMTGESQIIYIGHSQGTTSYFVMCSEKPEYNDKVALMISLSAVAYMSHLKSPIVRLLATFHKDIELISQLVGYNEFLPSNILTKTFTSLFCKGPQFASLICANLLSVLCGFDCSEVDVKNAPVIYGHLPSGSSTKQLIHYLQEVKSGRFRKFDYGPLKNYDVYGTRIPPVYNVEIISSPIAIFHSDNDLLSNFVDVKVLINRLPNVVDVYRVPLDKFSHVDYLFAKDANILVHPKLFELVETYSSNIQR